MNKLLGISAIAEAATGLAMAVVPSLVARLLLGAQLSGVAVPVARVAGIALFSLGIACWPGKESRGTGLLGMMVYSLLVTLYLLYLGLGGEWVGLLLWPAIGLHALQTALLVRAGLAARKGAVSSPKVDG